MFRAPLPEQRRCVPHSAPHPEADDMVLRGGSVRALGRAQDGLGRAGSRSREKVLLGSKDIVCELVCRRRVVMDTSASEEVSAKVGRVALLPTVYYQLVW